MSQQLGVVVMIDVEAAIEANTLKNNTYMFDNMKLQGSEALGTDALVSRLNGSHWLDGSMANEQILNWVPVALGSIPPTMPKSFLADKSKHSDLRAINEIKALADRVERTEENRFADTASILEELKRITANTGIKTKRKNKYQGTKRDLGTAGQKIIDVTGELVSDIQTSMPEVSSISPIITDITGEAVDKKVMYVAEYGSPELVTDGWYWCGSVDSSKTGTYAYTMHIQLHQLSWIDEEWIWVPVDMSIDAYINVTNNPKVNGFTHADKGMLPIM